MAHIERRADRWRARYRGLDGRERSRTFDRKADAQRWLAGVEIAKARGDWIDPALGRQLFREWVEEWETTVVDLRPSTRDRDLRIARVHLLPRFGDVALGRIAPTAVRSFIGDLVTEGRLAPATVRKIGQVLIKIMRAAVEGGLIARSPCDGLKLPAEGTREMRFLTAEQVVEMADATGTYRTLVFTAAYTGLRWGELAGLRIERLNVLRRTVAVVEQLNELGGQLSFGPPKTAAGRRSVSLPVGLAVMLREHVLRPEVAHSGLVFPTPLGEPMRRSNFARRVWAPATKAVGLEGLRFHDLRHTAVALAISVGAHPKAIQERMGHSTVTVTLDRYGHLFDGLDERIADGLDEVLAASYRGLSAASTPSEVEENLHLADELPGHSGGASKNRTCDLILIRDAL